MREHNFSNPIKQYEQSDCNCKIDDNRSLPASHDSDKPNMKAAIYANDHLPKVVAGVK